LQVIEKTKNPETCARVGGVLKIGTVARQLGISASMIRAWEKLGLTRPSRTGSSYRMYSSEDVRVLRRAVYLRRVLGLNAPAILKQLREEGLLNHDRDRSSDGTDQPLVGPRLRNLRLERGESLSTVAQAVGVSIGFLSNLERSQVSASIGVMRKLAQYYGLNILDFFSPDDATHPLVRPQERRILEGGEGVRMELLAWGKIIMEPHLFRVAPGAGSGESYSHLGEEFLYLTSGQLITVLGDQEYQLRVGDSFYFESKTPHRWHNPGKKEAVILWINTPPTF
jgi:DNA-binding transcriptional MerR regulator/mannose-6-phosphate isomerase-like protein (cupin superfamily)